MIGGLLKQIPPPRIMVADPDSEKRAHLIAKGCEATADNAIAITGAQMVVLAIKPQMAAQVVPGLRAAWQPHQVLVSILAGTPITKLAGWLPTGAHIIRAMPNTPLAIGQGMVGICPGSYATDMDLSLTESLFAPCGKVLRVGDENRMDAITAVSGSGPAYFFRFAEALVAAAMQLGFTREEAILLIGQTGAGSWEYLLQSGFEATKLREQVTSPGGTTAAALKILDEADFVGLVGKALAAAEARGKELAAG
jgi:pyrroline-5-carboxylate reductase